MYKFLVLFLLIACSSENNKKKDMDLFSILELENIVLDQDDLSEEILSDLDFGSIFYGQTTRQQIILSNTSASSVEFISEDFDFSSKNNFEIKNGCLVNLLPRKKCAITISLRNGSSLSADTMRSGNLKIKNHTFNLNALFINNISNLDTEILISPLNLDFENQETNTAKQARITIRNNGQVSRIFDMSGFNESSVIINNNCPINLGSRQTCSITITSTPIESSNTINQIVGQIFGKNIAYSRNAFEYTSENPQQVNVVSLNSSSLEIPSVEAIISGEAIFKNNSLIDFNVGSQINSDIENLTVNSNGCDVELIRGQSCKVSYSIPSSLPSGSYYIKLKNFNQESQNHSISVVSSLPQCSPNQVLKNGVCLFYLEDIFVGQNTICSKMSNGVVKCAGANSSNLLGISPTTNILSPVEITALNGAKKVSISSGHSCAIMIDNSVKCAGANSSGQLGLGDTTARSVYTDVPAYNGAIDIQASGTGTCALFSDNTIKCSGSNSDGGFGIGSNNTVEHTPVLASSFNGAKDMFFYGNILCAILIDDTIKCSGRNNIGQLGNGNTINTNVAVTIAGFEGFISYVRGGTHQCALMSDESVKCSGYSSNASMGMGEDAQYLNAIINPNFINVKELYSNNDRTCAQLNDNSFICTGNNGAGALGLGNFTHPITTPQESVGFYDMKKYVLGVNNTCAVTMENELKCTGYNLFGQLGLGNTTSINVPTLLPLFYE